MIQISPPLTGRGYLFHFPGNFDDLKNCIIMLPESLEKADFFPKF